MTRRAASERDSDPGPTPGPERNIVPGFLFCVSRSTFLAERMAAGLGGVCVMPEFAPLRPLPIRGEDGIARAGPAGWAGRLWQIARFRLAGRRGPGG